MLSIMLMVDDKGTQLVWGRGALLLCNFNFATSYPLSHGACCMFYKVAK